MRWFDEHGRKNLPWQLAVNPYRVWVSEVMLQQTQVATAIPYFERFMQRFPDLQALACAPLDDVLHLWTGLGYYARARNLHKAAQQAQACWQALPDTLEDLEALPGIGRSTAGAILSLGWGRSASILDGNVKRVLSRHFAIAGDPASAQTQRQLWAFTDALTPVQRTGAYNQAMMDLGATLCKRSQPACSQCPLQETCLAYQQGEPTAYPQKRRKKVAKERRVSLWMFIDTQQQVWLQQRPPQGIWGGLWSLPERDYDEDLPAQAQVLDEFVHVFSHFSLRIKPVVMPLSGDTATDVIADAPGAWVALSPLPAIGLPAPILTLLERLSDQLLR